jgi:hypothetical protein
MIVSHGGAGGQQDQRVQQRQMPRIEGAEERAVGCRHRRPYVTDQVSARDLTQVSGE